MCVEHQRVASKRVEVGDVACVLELGDADDAVHIGCIDHAEIKVKRIKPALSVADSKLILSTNSSICSWPLCSSMVIDQCAALRWFMSSVSLAVFAGSDIK
jgi:hypothetical protein